MGEGLQHDDGHSHILASVVPNICTYDPAFHYEFATIVKDGLRRMYENQEDIFYYITAYNENYAMPQMPEGVEEGIIKGIYLFRKGEANKKNRVQLLGSGTILREALKAADILAEKHDIAADVWSVTSYLELRREALKTEEWNDENQGDRKPYITQVLENTSGPVIAVTDYMRSLPDMISRWVPNKFRSLGTDGFGLSDTRESLRAHFKVDADSIVKAALSSVGKTSRKHATKK
jgi:pyruvate dehydrogenase E1 component